MKAYIETFGCQMNEYDSERIQYYLERKGFERTPSIEDSDIIVINTCAVREKAETRMFGHLGSFKSYGQGKRIICVGGCSAQSLGSKIQKKFPFVDIVFGTYNISQLPVLIDRRLKGEKKICSIADSSIDHSPGEAKRLYKYRALIPVSMGCNNFCSYCIVPYVRGREKSIPPDIIIDSIKKLLSDGVIQVTLLGQNVNSYGMDLQDGTDFSYLLEKVSDIKGLERIRFMTSHPKDLSLSLIETIRDRTNVMNHIHLPLQAGSDRILEKMNRKYDRNKYLEIVDSIRKNIKDCSITTDIIVGFPGEERVDFEDTLDMVERVGFDRAFTFIYSPRRGTSAADMEDTVPLSEKKEWFNELLDVQNNISYRKNNGYVGKIFKVLVEGFSPRNTELLQGRMENNIVVIFEGEDCLVGSIVDIEITEAMTFYVRGKIVQQG